MRRHWKTAAALSVLMMSSIIAPLASASTKGSTSYNIQTVSYSIPTKYGHIYLEVDRPVDPQNPDKLVKAPTILTYSPYAILEGRNSDASSWVPQGYARAWADVVGTGNSGGCFDYGGKSEGITGHDVVEFIAKQKWSDGRVGMLGGSYDGTTQWATAVTQPPHLTTIVPEAAIDRWYDYAYSGGIRYLDNNEAPREGAGAPADEGVDTPLAFDFGLALPPPTDTSDPDWATRTQERIRPCDQLEHTQQGYSQTPDYGKFWMERDYIHDADKINIPVLIAANWGDWNVKQQQSIDMFNALHNSPDKKLYMGNAFSGHGVPGGDYEKFVHAWFDHYLMGANNGVQNAPQVHSQTSNYDGPQKWYAGSWPKTKNLTLYFQEQPLTNAGSYQWVLSPMKPMKGMPGMPTDVAQFPSSNINTESHAAHHARNNHDWIWFEAPPFKRDVHMFGQPKLQIQFPAHRQWITLTPTLLEMDPSAMKEVEGQMAMTDPKGIVGVTRGWLDSRYRDGLAKQAKPFQLEKNYEMTVPMKSTDWIFKKGNSIGVNVQTEINEWSIPKPYPCGADVDANCPYFTLDWQDAKTRLILPIENMPKNPMDLFESGMMHM